MENSANEFPLPRQEFHEALDLSVENKEKIKLNTEYDPISPRLTRLKAACPIWAEAITPIIESDLSQSDHRSEPRCKGMWECGVADILED